MTVRVAGPPPGTPSVDLRDLERRGQTLLRQLGHASSELSVSLVDDARMAEMNERHRGRRGPTDVLSFSLFEGPFREHRGRMLGEVVIGIETARVQARETHRSLDERVTRLLIHGLLHLLGHDHEDRDEARVMRLKERRLWRALQA